MLQVLILTTKKNTKNPSNQQFKNQIGSKLENGYNRLQFLLRQFLTKNRALPLLAAKKIKTIELLAHQYAAAAIANLVFRDN